MVTFKIDDQDPTFPDNAPRASRRFWFVALGAAVLAVAASAWYVFWQDNQLLDDGQPQNQIVPDALSWLEYENPDYGFGLRYPKQWFYAEEPASRSAIYQAVLRVRDASAQPSFIRISIFENSKNLTAEKWLTSSRPATFGSQGGMPKVIGASLGGVAGVRIEEQEGDRMTESIVVRLGRNIFTIASEHDRAISALERSVLDDVVASVSFSQDAADSSDIYRNPEFGFSLDLPGAWDGYLVRRSVFPTGLVTLAFNLPSQERYTVASLYGFAEVFALAVFPQSLWKVWERNLDGITPEYMAENENFVFTWRMSTTTPQDLVARAQEVQGIIKSFKFTEASKSP